MITLDHIGLPARDNHDAATHLAHILGAGYHGPDRHFAPVHVNPELSLDFYTVERVEPHPGRAPHRGHDPGRRGDTAVKSHSTTFVDTD